jgi:hypothetical protein
MRADQAIARTENVLTLATKRLNWRTSVRIVMGSGLSGLTDHTEAKVTALVHCIGLI